jgi:ribosomal protein L14
MVQKESLLVPIDKCGVWFTKVFHLYGGSRRKISKVNYFVKVSVKQTKPNNWVKKKSKLKAIILKSSKEICKFDGSIIKFKLNKCVLLKKRLTPKGRELVGSCPFTTKRRRFMSSFIKII